MDNGNWVVGGEDYWYEAAVIISDGDDSTRWRMVKIPRPDSLELLFPETAIVNRPSRKPARCPIRGVLPRILRGGPCR